MKTERQWQRLWEKYCGQYKREHPQTRDYLAAEKLLLEYTQYQRDPHVNEEWRNTFSYLGRFFTGSWNRHHVEDVINVLSKHKYGKNKTYLLKTTDNFDHIPLANPKSNSENTKARFSREWVYLGTESQSLVKQTEYKKFDKAIKARRIEKGILTLEDGNSYQLDDLHIEADGDWYAKFQAIIKRKQAYELLNDLQAALADKSLNPNGDLAKILRVISKNTGHPIAVSENHFMSFNHYGSMVKDFVDTFKPYKTEYHFNRDLKQPINGLTNLVKGVFSLVGAPLIFVRNLFSLVFFSRSHDGSWASLGEDIIHNLALTFTEPLNYLADMLYTLIRGASQVATTPLLLFKVLHRVRMSGNSSELAENLVKNSKTIQEMFHTLDQMQNGSEEKREFKAQLSSEIHRKYLKNVGRGSPSSSSLNEHSLFMNAQYPQHSLKDSPSINPENAQNEYLSQFRAL